MKPALIVGFKVFESAIDHFLAQFEVPPYFKTLIDTNSFLSDVLKLNLINFQELFSKVRRYTLTPRKW